MNEDRELLQNQYKDITHELYLKTDMLRKYKHKVLLIFTIYYVLHLLINIFTGKVFRERNIRHSKRI